jgi:tyrosyl-tRNA synthetase
MADESKTANPWDDMTLDERLERALSVGEECIQPEELKVLLEKNPNPLAYDGFEPSGRMHIAQGIMKSINVNKLTSVGVKCLFWVADWFAMLNNKMGGDLKKIQKVGEYMIEVWKAAGMNMDLVEFKWASKEINERSDEYWMLVMDIARRFNLKRIKRCGTIMGREDNDNMPAAQILYPCMQCADIFFLKANICQLGMDQRKVNMLAREYLDYKDVKKKYRFKPIILSHHMLLGLKEGQEKMSKSDPDSAIFMEDTAADVKRKIKSAFCPPGVVYREDKNGKQVWFNPCMDYMKHIVFEKNGSCDIVRKDENGGNKTYTSYADMEKDFLSGALHPGDLKAALTKAVNEMIEPVRKHFASGAPKALLKQVRSFKVTR